VDWITDKLMLVYWHVFCRDNSWQCDVWFQLWTVSRKYHCVVRYSGGSKRRNLWQIE